MYEFQLNLVNKSSWEMDKSIFQFMLISHFQNYLFEKLNLLYSYIF